MSDPYRARQIAYYAKLKCELVQPDCCEACEKPVAKLHMHHDDYTKPLEIIWLCNSCHRLVHARGWYGLIRELQAAQKRQSAHAG